MSKSWFERSAACRGPVGLSTADSSLGDGRDVRQASNVVTVEYSRVDTRDHEKQIYKHELSTTKTDTSTLNVTFLFNSHHLSRPHAPREAMTGFGTPRPPRAAFTQSCTPGSGPAES
ncbi:hypothetical protein DTO166G4_4971 [Paecilomyces variotii]|nr:hypothetical protein DTO164E3_4799 [Paecilomyces variotii]KAJ9213528.1 hypothetical protein DTO166G4_4971 [Paecilomyces variotii]KAJ9233487.1 hypothetical protein DTO166G5_5610 [Paecilomyces variotii]KAJ9265226.1 hypothetical protein DTO195F2_1838 [Paecilomyces variotii]KAJ9307890.1 hypothetical protein DTO217A2_2646 [Paecilomyces variotii]